MHDLPQVRSHQKVSRAEALQILGNQIFRSGRMDPAMLETLFTDALDAVVRERPRQERNTAMLKLYWGIDPEGPMTYAEVATRYNIHQSRVREAIKELEHGLFRPAVRALYNERHKMRFA